MKQSLLKLFAILFVLAAAFVLAVTIGQKKYIYDVHFFAEGIPVPVAHDIYSGTAVWESEEQVRVSFSPVGAPDRQKEPYLFCVGYVLTDKVTCYLLQGVDGMIVEKATFIEPFIDAVRLSMIQFRQTSNPPKEMSKEIERLIPWENRSLLEDLETWNNEIRTVETKEYFPWR